MSRFELPTCGFRVGLFYQLAQRCSDQHMAVVKQAAFAQPGHTVFTSGYICYDAFSCE